MSGRRTVTAVTQAQQAVLDYIVAFTAEHGQAPSLKEMQKQFGWANGGERHHLAALRFKGLVTWQPGKARTLRVVEREDGK